MDNFCCAAPDAYVFNSFPEDKFNGFHRLYPRYISVTPTRNEDYWAIFPFDHSKREYDGEEFDTTNSMKEPN